MSYVKFCSHLRIFVHKDLRGVVTPNKTTSRHKIVVFKMASINKHHLLAVVLVILRRRKRRENRKNGKKKMNENRLELVAFSTTFLLTREFDRASFFE